MHLKTAVLVAIVLLGETSGASAEEMTNCQRLAAIGVSPKDEHQTSLDAERHCFWLFWRKFQWRPLTEVLTTADLTSLGAEIERGNCEQAAVTVRDRFQLAHPLVPSLKDERNYDAWRMRLGVWYPALETCLTVREIDQLQAQFDRSGVQPAPYAGPDSPSLMNPNWLDPSKTYTRDRLINTLVLHFLAVPHPSGALALLRWSVEGKIMKSQADRELYIAYWLRDHGVADPIVDAVIGRDVDPVLRADIQRRASIHPRQMPAYTTAP